MTPDQLIFGLIIVVVFGVPVLLARRRQMVLARVAGAIGFTFTPRDQAVWNAGFTTFPLFQTAQESTPVSLASVAQLMFGRYGGKITNLLRGAREGQEIWLFDYQYATGGAVSRYGGTVRHTVAAIRLKENVLPAFTLAPEGAIQRIFGSGDIDFPSHVQFSRQFLLRGPDERSVRELFTPGTLETLTRLPPRLGVQGGDGWLVVCGPLVRPDPEAIRAFLEKALRVFQAFGKR